ENDIEECPRATSQLNVYCFCNENQGYLARIPEQKSETKTREPTSSLDITTRKFLRRSSSFSHNYISLRFDLKEKGQIYHSLFQKFRIYPSLFGNSKNTLQLHLF